MTPKYREYISNSVEAAHLDTVGVVGSIPIEPTNKSTKNAGKCLGFSQKSESLGIAVFGHFRTQKDTNSHPDCGKIAVWCEPSSIPTYVIRLMRCRSKIRTEGYARSLILTARPVSVKGGTELYVISTVKFLSSRACLSICSTSLVRDMACSLASFCNRSMRSLLSRSVYVSFIRSAGSFGFLITRTTTIYHLIFYYATRYHYVYTSQL